MYSPPSHQLALAGIDWHSDNRASPLLRLVGGNLTCTSLQIRNDSSLYRLLLHCESSIAYGCNHINICYLTKYMYTNYTVQTDLSYVLNLAGQELRGQQSISKVRAVSTSSKSGMRNTSRVSRGLSALKSSNSVGHILEIPESSKNYIIEMNLQTGKYKIRTTSVRRSLPGSESRTMRTLL